MERDGRSERWKERDGVMKGWREGDRELRKQ